MPAIVSQRAYLSSNREAPWRCRRWRLPMLICSSTSSLACQKKRYGEMVVPRSATRMPMYLGSSWIVGTSVPARTPMTSGRANRAAPI